MTDKYVGLQDRKQEVLDTSVAILTTAAGREIPIVVTSERGRITVFWWTAARNQWESWTRRHTAHDPAPASMAAYAAARWSDRVAVAAHLDRVFVVYRREVTIDSVALEATAGGLYADVLTWDDPNERLIGGAPAEIPMGALGYDATGYYLWAGTDAASSSLVVLCQGVSRSFRYFVEPGRGSLGGRFGFRAPKLGLGPGTPAAPFREPKLELGPRAHGRIPPFQMPEKGMIPGWNVPGRPVVVTSEVTHLLMLRAPYNASLGAAASWSPPLRIDEGGYDFDACLKGGVLSCVYRREAYSVTLSNIVPVADNGAAQASIPADPILGCTHAPLYYREVDVAALTISATVDGLHGGEHPQLQRLAPLSITFDRVFRGQLEIERPTPGVRLVRPRVDEFGKMLCVYDNQQSSVCRLFGFDGRRVPRNLVSRGGVDPAVAELAPAIAVEVSVTTASFSNIAGYVPAYFVGADSDAKAGNWDFLHHAHPSGLPGSLAVQRYAIALSGASLTGTAIVDVNHRQLGGASEQIDLAPPQHSSGENRQFRPFRIDGAATDAIDNTIGGALAVERSVLPPKLFAYTDLGDGGCRAIFATDVKLAPLAQSKLASLESVTGPGIALDRVATLPLGDFSQYTLPIYPVTLSPAGGFNTNNGEPGALVCGLHVAFDTALQAIGFGACAGGPVTAACGQTTGEGITSFDTGGETFFSAADGAIGPRAAMILTPVVPYFGISGVTLDPVPSSDPNYDLTSFQYGLADGTPDLGVIPTRPANSERVRFGSPGSRTLTLTVGNANGLSAPTNEVEVTLSGRPAAPRGLYATQAAATDPVTLRWLRPDFPAGTAMIRYHVTRRSAGVVMAQFISTTLSFTESPPPAPGVYEYTVAAENAAGTGRDSVPVRVPVGSAIPAPQFTATRQTGAATLTIRIPPELAASMPTLRVYRREYGGTAYTALPAANVPSPVFPQTSFNDPIGWRRRGFEYVAALVVTDSAGVPREGFWSQPSLAWASTVPPATPGTLSYSVAGGNVSLAWQVPVLAAGATTAGYRVFRKPPGGAYAEIGTAGAPPLPATTTAYADIAPGGGAGDTWFYYIIAQNGSPASDTVSADICVHSFFDDLWPLHPDFTTLVPPAQRCALPTPPGEAPLVAIFDANVEIGKFRVAYRFAGSGATRTRDSVTLSTLAAWKVFLREKNGLVEVRFDIHFDSTDIQVLPTEVAPLLTAADMLTINSVAVDAEYQRAFTPCVLMSDQRAFDPFFMNDEVTTETLALNSSGPMVAGALAAKPVGLSSMESVHVDVDLSLNWRTIGLLIFAAFLLILGVTVLASVALVGLSAVVSVTVGPFGVIRIPMPAPLLDPLTLAATLLAAVVIGGALAEPIVTLVVEAKVRDKVREELKLQLDQTSFIWCAGEGVAEELAFRGLGALGLTQDLQGRNRFRAQCWQMVAMANGACKLFARN